MGFEAIPFSELLSEVVDNRGRTCPTEDAGIPLIATNCIRNELLYPTYEKARFVSLDTYSTWFRGHPKPGDILFVNKATPGRVCLVPDPVDFCIAQDMVAVRADQNKIYPKYLLAALRSPLVQDQIAQMHVGTLIPHFKKSDFDELLIPVPSSDEQRFIGDVYFDLSAKIDLNRRINETLEGIGKAIFKSWFVDFDSVRAKIDSLHPSPIPADLSAVSPISFVDSDRGAVPTGWRLSSIHEAAEVLYGRAYKSDLFNDSCDGRPLIRIRDLATHAPKVYTTEQIDGELEIHPGDLVVGMDGEFPVVHWLGPESVLNQRVCTFRPKPGFPAFFLSETIRKPIRHFEETKSGTTVIHLLKSDIDTFEVLIPPKPVLDAFASLTDPLVARIVFNAKESRLLAELRNLLLPKLISGQIRIREAEQMAEAAVGG